MDVLESLRKPLPPRGDAVFYIQYLECVPSGGRRYPGSVLAGNLSKGLSLTAARGRARAFRIVEVVHSGDRADGSVATLKFP